LSIDFFSSYHLLCEPEYIVYLDFDNNYHCSLRNFSENEMVVICPETSVAVSECAHFTVVSACADFT